MKTQDIITKSFSFILSLSFICSQSFLYANDAINTGFSKAPHSIGLAALEEQLEIDLDKLNIPARPWVVHPPYFQPQQVLDVAIIGGGMAGLTASFALLKEGICNIMIFDENSSGDEGVWDKYARMNILRSGKIYMGPALNVPSLTFWSWYEAQYGQDDWENLKMIPRTTWSDYLRWYRHALKLPVENNMILKALNPSHDFIELVFDHRGQSRTVYARKVVLATGREGFGGHEIPEFMYEVSKKFYAHTGERIDPESLRNKRITIIGAGASAFDAAAVALEHGAVRVDMLVRRSAIPNVNKYMIHFYQGITHGFYYLSDEMRCLFYAITAESGTPPPKSALERVDDFDNLYIHFNTSIREVYDSEDSVTLITNRGPHESDFIILATGYCVSGLCRPELGSIIDSMMMWEDHVPPTLLDRMPKLAEFPYLGPHFEFLEKEPGTAPYLKNIYCFNYGAMLSHGFITSDIPRISHGATRLAEGIAIDFFLHDSEVFLQRAVEFNSPSFDPQDYKLLKR